MLEMLAYSQYLQQQHSESKNTLNTLKVINKEVKYSRNHSIRDQLFLVFQLVYSS